MPKIRMRLEFGYYSNDEEGRTELRLVDDSTGFNFARLHMDARQFRDFLSGSSTKVDVDVPKPRFMALLGADMKVETVEVPYEVYAGAKSSGDDIPHSVRKHLEKVHDQRSSALDVGQVVQVEARHTNAGWKLVIRTYTMLQPEDDD